MKEHRVIKIEGWRATLAIVIFWVIMALATLGAANLVFMLTAKADYRKDAFSSRMEERLFRERQRYHGLDKRFHKVWEEEGRYYFRDDTGRTGRFI
jgi:phosphate/sulfate permease